jgi:hypothetical protein
MATRKRPGTGRDYIGGIPEQGYVPRGGGYSRKTTDVPVGDSGKVAQPTRSGGRTAKEAVGDSGKFESGKRAPTMPGRGRRTAQERKAFKERTKETRRKIREADEAAKAAERSPTSVPKKRAPPTTQEEISAVRKGRQEMSRKIGGAKQIRGPKRKTPSGQKGMLLPGKGETILRSKGGYASKNKGVDKAKRRKTRSTKHA